MSLDSDIAVLSEKSVADRSRSVDFPDFTKGKWKTTPPIKLMGMWAPIIESGARTLTAIKNPAPFSTKTPSGSGWRRRRTASWGAVSRRSKWRRQTSRPSDEWPYASRVANSMDAFIAVKLREQKLAFAPETGKRTLLRRVYLDLFGLPPPPEAVDAFLSDQSSAAYENLIDRLFISPQYGERWGRHWLDAAGNPAAIFRKLELAETAWLLHYGRIMSKKADASSESFPV